MTLMGTQWPSHPYQCQRKFLSSLPSCHTPWQCHLHPGEEEGAFLAAPLSFPHAAFLSSPC